MYGHMWNVDLCRIPADHELARLRALRRQHAQGEAEPVREVAKFHKRRVKAATILLNFYEGATAVDAFPAELLGDFSALLMQMTERAAA